MELSVSSSAIWKEIERSESYLVCSMFEEAVSVSSSVLRQLRETNSTEIFEGAQFIGMVESAGMALIQSLKALGRTREILNELISLLGSVTAIPAQILLIGACFQISEGSLSGLQESFEEFLSSWKYVNKQFYVLANVEVTRPYMDGFDSRFMLEVEKYLEVVEFYAVTLLGTVLNEVDRAISWIETNELPEGRQEELLRRLHSLYSLKASNSSQGVESSFLAEKNETITTSGIESKKYGVEESSRPKALSQTIGGNDTNKSILRLSQPVYPYLWWFRNITIKFHNVRFVISPGKTVLLSSLIVFTCYVLRKKREALKRIARTQASTLKKALVDMWQLAFSVQVNPLAAVQPLPVATSGSR